MSRIYLVTGACGHLGNTIVRMLVDRGERVRGFVLPQEDARMFEDIPVELVRGDVRDKKSLEALFQGLKGEEEVYVIHTAGIVSITEKIPPSLWEVNVAGTRNVVELCLEHGVKKLVHVSSVHAIPEQENFRIIREVRRFHERWVRGGYAKTKAEASQLVLDAVEQGLMGVIVHPSGILGPRDYGHNHLMEMVKAYVNGKLPACVHGGYDFVDVRDVAAGCLAAAERGRVGQCYILSNRHYEITEVLSMLGELCARRPVPALPLWMARLASPFTEFHARRTHQTPLFTRYSLSTLHGNDKFSHELATQDLDYHPRDLYDTLRDTVDWLRKEGLAPAPGKPAETKHPRRRGMAT